MMNRDLKADVGLSQLIVVDMQSRLLAVMHTEAMQEVMKNCSILLRSATLLNVPLVVTEQNPMGLGYTAPELTALLAETRPVEKITFSCLAEPKFKRQLTSDRTHIVIAGLEAHICVLQTALDLIVEGKQVFVVEDAVISRNPANKANALARLRHEGCIVTNTESLVFEWLGAAGGDAFKVISKLIR